MKMKYIKKKINLNGNIIHNVTQNQLYHMDITVHSIHFEYEATKQLIFKMKPVNISNESLTSHASCFI